MLDRIPPQALDAEQSILSACLLDTGTVEIIQPILSVEDFYTDAHRHIYAAILDLYAESQPTDTISVANKLRQNKHFDESGGPAYLGTLVNEVPMTVNAPYYAKIVQEKATLRRLISATQEIATKCYDDTRPAQDLIDAAEAAVFSITEKKARNQVHKAASLVDDAIFQVSRRMSNRSVLTGVPTGLSRFDSRTGGLQPSDLIILAARPGMGKTSLAMNIAVHAAREKVPVLVFSLEMSKEQLIARLLCSEGNVDSTKARSGFIGQSDFARLLTAQDKIKALPLFLDDSPILTALDVRTTARKLSREQDIGLVVVDYLQLMRGSRRRESRELEIAEISRALKALAKELNIPVIGLSQLNREVEKAGQQEPKLSHLRESGAIEQDADMILFLWQREQVGEEIEKIPVELKCAKHRNGSVFRATLIFNKPITHFTEAEQ